MQRGEPAGELRHRRARRPVREVRRPQRRAQLASERLVAPGRVGGQANSKSADLACAERDPRSSRVTRLEAGRTLAEHLHPDRPGRGGFECCFEVERRSRHPDAHESGVQSRADADGDLARSRPEPADVERSGVREPNRDPEAAVAPDRDGCDQRRAAKEMDLGVVRGRAHPPDELDPVQVRRRLRRLQGQGRPRQSRRGPGPCHRHDKHEEGAAHDDQYRTGLGRNRRDQRDRVEDAVHDDPRVHAVRAGAE